MKQNRPIKYCWGASRVVRGKWVLGVFCRYERTGKIRAEGIAVSIRGVLIWLMLLGAGIYAAGAGFVWLRWQRQPHFDVSYADVLFAPLRREELAKKRGQALLAEGQEHFQARRWTEAAERLQRGLVVHPGDAAARVSLAQVYMHQGEAPRAERLLMDGLGEGFPGRTYLELLFELVELGEDYEFVAQRCAQYLPELNQRGARGDVAWLMQRRFAALLAAGRPQEALAFAETGASDGEQQVVALLAGGRAAEAVVRLQRWREQPGADLREILPLQVRAWRETGAVEAMERGLVEWRSMEPAAPEAWIQSVVEQALAGRAAAADLAFDEFVRRFGTTAENLSRLTVALGAIDQTMLLQRCVETATERGFASLRVQAQVLLVHALLHRGDWLEAGRAFVGIAPQKEDAPMGTPAWRAWMQGLLACAQGQSVEADAALLTRLREQKWPFRVWRETIETLVRAERFVAARDVIALVGPVFPANQWLKAKAGEMKLEIMARTEAVPASAAPSPAIPAEQFFALRLDDLLRAGRWEEAAAHVQQAQGLRPAPPWLEAQAGHIAFAQVRIAHGQGDSPGMKKAARLYLNGDDERSRRLLELARTMLAGGDRSQAVGLVREIVSRSPQDVAARTALEEWEPVPAQKTAVTRRLETTPERKATGVMHALEVDDEAATLLKDLRLRAALGEVAQVLGNARALLTGDRARSDQVLEVARELYAAGDRSTALLLVREVGRKSPGYPPANRLLNEWERATKQ